MPHRTNLLAVLVLVAAAAAGCGEQPAPTPAAAPPTILGTWRLMGKVDNELPDLGIELRWTFSTDEVVVADDAGREVSRNRYSIDASHVPQLITMELRDVVATERRGLLVLDQDRLRVWFGEEGGPPPTEMADDNVLLFRRPTDRHR